MSAKLLSIYRVSRTFASHRLTLLPNVTVLIFFLSKIFKHLFMSLHSVHIMWFLFCLSFFFSFPLFFRFLKVQTRPNTTVFFKYYHKLQGDLSPPLTNKYPKNHSSTTLILASNNILSLLQYLSCHTRSCAFSWQTTISKMTFTGFGWENHVSSRC